MNSELVHVGYALMLCALIARDILWLRAILAFAQFTLCLYAISQNLVGMAGWNALFVLINLVWVLRIAHERRSVELPGDLREFHLHHFSAFSPAEFLRIWDMGQQRDLRDATFIHQGDQPAALYFLMSGEAAVVQDGREVARLRSGRFAAEMSLLTGQAASADVTASGDLKLHCWPAEHLLALRLGAPLLWSKLQSAIGYDLVEKIRMASKPAA